MSYARFTVIYGLPLHSKHEPRPDEVEELIESEHIEGLQTFYSGSADERPAAFGVRLAQFDECVAFINVDSLVLAPNALQQAAYDDMWNKLDPEEQKLLAQYGKPRVFFFDFDVVKRRSLSMQGFFYVVSLMHRAW